jgi:AcrR family transcriptional regulator
VARLPVVQLILDQTIKTIEEQGEVSVRLRDLVSETGVALATIYKYFGNREGLLDSAYAEMYFQSAIHPLATFEEAMKMCTTAAECAALIESYLRIQSEPDAVQRRRIRMTVIGSAQARPQLADKLAEMNLQYAELFSRIMQPAQEKGWITSDFDLRTVAIWFMGMVNTRAPMDFRPSDWNQEEMHRLYVSSILDKFIVR